MVGGEGHLHDRDADGLLGLAAQELHAPRHGLEVDARRGRATHSVELDRDRLRVRCAGHVHLPGRGLGLGIGSGVRVRGQREG